jgi:C7-cyclitol 7-kinase
MNRSCRPLQALVFDVGGTFLRCAVWNSTVGLSNLRRLKLKSFILVTNALDAWDSLLSDIEHYVASVAHLVHPDAPIVLSFAGPVENNRYILDAPTILGKIADIPDLVRDLERRTGRQTYALNDLSAAAWHLSLTSEIDRFMVITVSSGIGSKIYDRSNPLGVVDVPAWAGEIGHLVVDEAPEAPYCDCGEQGHLGAIASGRGIERAAQRFAAEVPSSFAKSICAIRYGATAASINNESHLVPAALSGDEWSLDVIRRATKPLASVILAVVVATGIGRVILIGGFALGLGSVYLQIVHDELASACRYRVLKDKIGSLLELGPGCEDACLLGAAAFARRVLEAG